MVFGCWYCFFIYIYVFDQRGSMLMEMVKGERDSTLYIVDIVWLSSGMHPLHIKKTCC